MLLWTSCFVKQADHDLYGLHDRGTGRRGARQGLARTQSQTKQEDTHVGSSACDLHARPPQAAADHSNGDERASGERQPSRGPLHRRRTTMSLRAPRRAAGPQTEASKPQQVESRRHDHTGTGTTWSCAVATEIGTLEKNVTSAGRARITSPHSAPHLHPRAQRGEKETAPSQQRRWSAPRSLAITQPLSAAHWRVHTFSSMHHSAVSGNGGNHKSTVILLSGSGSGGGTSTRRRRREGGIAGRSAECATRGVRCERRRRRRLLRRRLELQEAATHTEKEKRTQSASPRTHIIRICPVRERRSPVEAGATDGTLVDGRPTHVADANVPARNAGSDAHRFSYHHRNKRAL